MVESTSTTSRWLPGPAPIDHARRRVSPTTASSWRTWPKVNDRRKVASVEGAIARCGRTRCVPPERSTSAWSMWEPPTTMACTSVSTLRPGSAPPTRPPSRTVPFTKRSSPSLATRVPTSSSPALATSFGSSKLTASRSSVCETRLTESASCAVDNCDFEHRNRRCSGGLSCGWGAYVTLVDRWIEAYSDWVFGLFFLLGYQFSPRLADLGEARFWRIDPRGDYGALNALGRQRLNT